MYSRYVPYEWYVVVTRGADGALFVPLQYRSRVFTVSTPWADEFAPPHRAENTMWWGCGRFYSNRHVDASKIMNQLQKIPICHVSDIAFTNKS